MGKPAVAFDLTAEKRREFSALVGRRRTGQKLAQGSRAVLPSTDSLGSKWICKELSLCPNTVGKLHRRYAERWLEGLRDKRRPSAPDQIGESETARIIRRTFEATAGTTTHWSSRLMAVAVGRTPSTIHRICSTVQLQPPRIGTLKLSTDPLLVVSENLTEHQNERGVHSTTRKLELAVRGYIQSVDHNLGPFKWTKFTDGLQASIKRFRLTATNLFDTYAKFVKVQN